MHGFASLQPYYRRQQSDMTLPSFSTQVRSQIVPQNDVVSGVVDTAALPRLKKLGGLTPCRLGVLGLLDAAVLRC